MEKFIYLIEDKWDFVLEVKPSSDDAKLSAFVSCKISKIYILVSNIRNIEISRMKKYYYTVKGLIFWLLLL